MNTILASNWIVPQTDFGDVCPVFKRNFKVEKELESAVMYMTALGVYQPKLNGKKLNDAVLMPGWTSYAKRLQVQSFDLKPILQQENELVVTLGKGWCVGGLTWNHSANLWSDKASILACISLQYKDGSNELIITDKDWLVTKSAVLFSSIYDGETYDSNICIDENSNWEKAAIFTHGKTMLIEQEGEWIKEVSILKAQKLIHTPSGETVIDFGQELTGYVNFNITGKKGDTATILHAEVLDKDGNFYTDNLRSAKQKITFICNGQKTSYKPHFTFQGFRFIKLVDWPEEVKLENFTALVVHSDLERTGRFECSNQKLNQLYSNIIWGQRGNFLDIPTDCPQRDERLGWTGDAEVFVRAASYNYNVKKFFTKWLRDLKADQHEDGGIPAVIPDVLGKEGECSSAWGDAAVICPWQIYLSYGDKSILKEQYDSMEAWINYIINQGDNKYLWNTGNHYGDWLGLDSADGSYEGSTDKSLIATAYFAYSTGLFIKAGKVLGRDMASYEKLYSNIISAFNDTYLIDGKLTSNTQTAHVLALYFNLCENKKALAANLANLIHQNGDKLTTGFVGTPYLLHALSDNGYADVAYTLLLQEDFPSWLFSVNMGATTIWEHWDGMRPDGTMWSTQMNSFNHYAYGAVADWMYSVMAGIRQSEQGAGFSHIILQPIVDKRISRVKASVDIKGGRISSAWYRENGKICYDFEVPNNSTADIVLGKKVYHVRAGKYRYKM